jgi:hypothetical protein
MIFVPFHHYLPMSGLWKWFYKGERQNTTHFKAYCWSCIADSGPPNAQQRCNANGDAPTFGWMTREGWFTSGEPKYTGSCQHTHNRHAAAKDGVLSVRGAPEPMAAHLRKCAHASEKAKHEAAEVERKRKEKEAEKKEAKRQEVIKRRLEEEGSSDKSGSQVKKARGNLGAAVRSFTQSKLQVFTGINIPFKEEEKAMIRTQFLRATVSANLPFRWTDDAEVIKLFLMFRARAAHDDVIPSRRALSGVLLNGEAGRVARSLKAEVSGKYGTLA